MFRIYILCFVNRRAYTYALWMIKFWLKLRCTKHNKKTLIFQGWNLHMWRVKQIFVVWFSEVGMLPEGHHNITCETRTILLWLAPDCHKIYHIVCYHDNQHDDVCCLRDLPPRSLAFDLDLSDYITSYQSHWFSCQH